MVATAGRRVAEDQREASHQAPSLSYWLLLGVVASLGMFIALWHLGTATWNIDELLYARVGLAYVHGHFAANQEHPFLAKDLIGLSQLVMGAGRVAARLPAALAGLLTGAVVWDFTRRVSGRGAALGALALWLLVPHAGWFVGYQLDVADLDRYGMLDVFAALFMMVAVTLGWRWATSGGWRWALGAGAAVGLATASKAPGILVLPVIVVAGVAGMVATGRWVRGVAQGFAVLLVAAATGMATYLPAGPAQAVNAIRYMWRFQSAHGAAGQPVILSGVFYHHPPWWAHLYWQTQNYGMTATVAGALAILAALFLGHRLVHLYLLAAAVVPWAYLSFLVGFALPHYYYLYQAPLAVLAAMGLLELLRRAQALHRVAGKERLAAASLGGVGLLALPFAVLAGRLSATVASLAPSDYSAAAQIISRHSAPVGIVAVAGYSNVEAAYLPQRSVIDARALSGPVSAILVDPLVTRRFLYPGLGPYLSSHSSGMTSQQVGRLTLYLVPK